MLQGVLQGVKEKKRVEKKGVQREQRRKRSDDKGVEHEAGRGWKGTGVGKKTECWSCRVCCWI